MKNITFNFYKTDNQEFFKHIREIGGFVVDVWSCYEFEVCVEVSIPQGADMSKFAEFQEK